MFEFRRWEQFGLSLIFLIVIPLFPLGIEKYVTASISEQSLTLTAAIYAISIGVSSKSKLYFGLSIAISMIFSTLFGITISNLAEVAAEQENPLPSVNPFVWFTIISFSTVHICERFIRHVRKGEKYWIF